MRSRWLPRSIAFLVGLGMAVGALATYVMLPAPTSDLSAPRPVTTFPVTSTSFADPRTVALRPSFSAQAQLSLGRSGVITESSCTPGVPFGSGTTVARVDSNPVIALATSIPFYRDLVPGTEGADVNALRAALRALGYTIDAEGPYRGAVIDSLADLQKRNGVNPADGAFRLADFVWIPASGGAPSECEVSVGEQYSQGSPFAVVPGSLRSLQLVPSTSAPVPGPRAARVAGVDVDLPESGVISDPEAVARVASSPEFAEALDSETIAASTELKDARQAVAVPPAAIFGIQDAAACVQDDNGEARVVSLLSSSLGRTLVTFPEGVDVPRAVRLSDAIDVTTCTP
ncbi:hypothetical protein FQ142_13365 [Microbacterium sp. ANT_H45B]|nr:hypothetical protein FQ142_13365 [Microbacterium sp. ANT_H45B]